MKYYHLIVLSSLLISACKLKNNDVIKDDSKEVWKKITITSEGGPTIHLDNYDDSTLVKLYPMFDFISPIPKIKKDIKSFNVYFTPAEKDSIYKLTSDLINNPAKRKKNVRNMLVNWSYILITVNLRFRVIILQFVIGLPYQSRPNNYTDYLKKSLKE